MKIKVSQNELLLLLFIFITFFLGLGYYAIANINEGLYAEIPREMIVNNNFIIPTLNFVPYLEKPPLLYWLIAGVYKLIGISEFSARLIPALSAASISLMSYYFSKRVLNERAGLVAGIILASNVLFFLMGRIILFDMLLTALFTAAMYGFYLWYSSDQKIYLHAAYVFLALAVLTKGFQVLFFAPAITFIFMSINRTPLKKQLKLFDPIGLFLFFVIATPWHILASCQNSEFAWQYFINEHVFRFLDKRIPNDYHHGPFYFYVPRILVYLLPWTFFTPLLLKKSSNKILSVFCWTWFLVVLIFFSISKAKGDYYMIMGMPPIIILLAEQISSTKLYQKIYDHKSIHIILFSIIILPLVLLYLVDKKNLELRQSEKNNAHLVEAKDTKVYFYKHFEDLSSWVFYLQRRVPIIDSQSHDLYFGSTTTFAEGWFVDMSAVKRDLSHESVYILSKKGDLNELQQKLSDYKITILSDNDNAYLLLANGKRY